MGLLAHFDTRLGQLQAMIAARGLCFDQSIGLSLESDMRSAMVRCISCRRAEDCRTWLAADDGERGAPDFCPNAARFARYEPAKAS